MKKAISLILAFVMGLALPISAFAAEDNTEPEYYTIQVEYSDNIGKQESLDVMIQNNNVYVDAKGLYERLGYTYGENSDCVTILNTDFSEDLPSSITQFKYNSTQVSHMLFNSMIDTYEAPFVTVKNSEGSWVPFEYSLLLLNSSMMIVDDTVRIDVPTKSIIHLFFDAGKNSERYVFDWADDFGYTEQDVYVLGGSSHLVNVFNGVLSFDGASWLSLFQQFAGNMDAYDKKYGEDLALLICTESDKELEASIENVEMTLDLLSEDGKLGKMLSTTSDMLDSQVGTLYNHCEDVLQDVIDGNSPLVSYNKSYQALEDALDRQTWFSNTGGNILEVQKGISSAAGKAFTVLDVGTKVLEIVGYANEFQNQDQFSLAALTRYLDTANKGLELPEMMKKSMVEYSDSLSSSIDQYMTEQLVKNIDQWIIDEVPMHEILGRQAAGALFAWNIASNTIPFVSNGLSGADNFELALYAIVFQADAYLNYLDKRDSVFADTENITVENMYELSQYCYIWLKSCYTAREAALASLDGKRDSIKEQIQPLIDEQNNINTEIAKSMVELKRANTSNDDLVFGFLPTNNEDYLSKYDDSQLIQWIRTSRTEELDDIYLEFLVSREYQSFISDWMYGQPNQYTILDIDKDGIEELIISGGDNFGFFSFAVFSYDKASNGIYALSFPENVLYGENYNGNISQYYGTLWYSSEYHALVFSELNNGSMFGSYGYFVVDDQELISDFYLWFETDYETQQISYGITKSDQQKEISQTDYDSYINEVINLEWIDIPTSTSSISSSKADLSEFMGTDLYSFVEKFDDMYDVGATDGSTEYSNGSIIVGSGFDSNNITFVSINGDCDYSILGIEYGMSFEMATELAYQLCDYIVDDLPYYKCFVMSNGTSLSFHAEDEKTVDGINLLAN